MAVRNLGYWGLVLILSNTSSSLNAAVQSGADSDKSRIDELVTDLGNPARQLQAAKALEELGPKAASATNDLVAILKQSFYFEDGYDEGFITNIEHALAAIGPQAISAIVANLDSYNTTLGPPLNLVRQLRRYHDDGVPALAGFLEHEDYRVRGKVLDSLGRMSRKAIPVIPTITKRLQVEPHPSVRLAAVIALGRIARSSGNPGREVLREVALPELLSATQSEDLDLQRSSVETLLLIDRDNHRGKVVASVVPILTQWLKHPAQEHRLAAVTHLARIRETAAPASDELIEAMSGDSSVKVRIGAAEALRATGSSEEKVIDAFIAELASIRLAASDSNQPAVSDVAQDALWRIGKPAIPKLTQKLGDHNRTVQFAAASVIVNIDPMTATHETIAIFVASLKDSSSVRRVGGTKKLAQLGTLANDAVPPLVERDPLVIEAAASALGKIGPAAKQAVPALVKLIEQLEAKRCVSKRQVHTALLKIDPGHSLTDESFILDELAHFVNYLLSGRTFLERESSDGDAVVRITRTFPKFELSADQGPRSYEGRTQRTIVTKHSDGRSISQEKTILTRLHQSDRSLFFTNDFIDESGIQRNESTFDVSKASFWELRIKLQPAALKTAKPGSLTGVNWQLQKAGIVSNWSYLDEPKVTTSISHQIHPTPPALIGDE